MRGLKFSFLVYYSSYQINIINEYFSKSFNYHNINVSCNIETKDGYTIYGHRNKLNTDANTIYCSSNGVGEIYDEYVAFYHNSVSEDYHTINYLSSKRVDFLGEIKRETLAELGISDGNEYKLCGLSFINHYDNEKEKKRIFNIIYRHKSDMDFKDILDCYQNASEKEENRTIVGIKQKKVYNYFDVIRMKSIGIIKLIGNSKATINALLAITIFILSIIKGYENNYNIIYVITIGFAVITLILSCYNIINIILKKRKFIKNVSTVYFYKNDFAINNFKKLQKKLLKLCRDKAKLHPISLVTFSSINKDLIDNK